MKTLEKVLRNSAVLLAVGLFAFALSAKAEILVAEVVRPAGNVVIYNTLDASGSVLDSSGKIIGRVVTVPVATTPTFLTGTVQVSGDIVDINGRVIAHVTEGSPIATGSIISGTVNSSGFIVDAGGHVVALASPASTVTKTTTLVTPSEITKTTTLVTPSEITKTTTTEVVGTSFGTMSDVLANALIARRGELSASIDQALASGKLTAIQASDFRAELDQIARSESTCKLTGGVMTFDEGILVARQLDSMSLRFAQATGFPTLTALVIVEPVSGVARFAVAPTILKPAVAIASEPVVGTTAVTTTTIPGGVTVTKTIIKEIKSNPDLFIMTLDTRRSELEKLIAHGIATGKISQAEADLLRAELDTLAALERDSRVKGVVLSSGTVAVIAARLDVLGIRLSNLLGTTVVPIITGDRFIVFNGQIVQLDEMTMRRAGLEAKIATSLAAGKISPAQATVLRAELDTIAMVEVRYRQANGLFTDKQARSLFVAFDRVGSKLDSFIASR
jgi:hypothetical protein